jgi:hypothetical protein
MLTAPELPVTLDAERAVESILRPVGVLAEECRQAYQGFLFGVASGWGEEHLATFLATTYADVAADAEAESDQRLRSPFGADARVDPTDANDLLQATRRDVLETLESLREGEGGKALAFRAVTSGWVVRVEDATGARGWMPVAKPSMRLKARVLSLVAADYLMRQDDYLLLLTICTRCERVVFDAGVRERGACCRVSASGMWLPPPASPPLDDPSRAPVR